MHVFDWWMQCVAGWRCIALQQNVCQVQLISQVTPRYPRGLHLYWTALQEVERWTVKMKHIQLTCQRLKFTSCLRPAINVQTVNIGLNTPLMRHWAEDWMTSGRTFLTAQTHRQLRALLQELPSQIISCLRDSHLRVQTQRWLKCRSARWQPLKSTQKTQRCFLLFTF